MSAFKRFSDFDDQNFNSKFKRRRNEYESLEKTKMETLSANQELNRREEDFIMRQTVKRAIIRIEQRRETSIDKLIKNALFHKDHNPTFAECEHPFHIIDALSLNELPQLLSEIEIQIQIGEDLPYYNTLKSLLKYKISSNNRSYSEVDNEIDSLLSDKSSSELLTLQSEVINDSSLFDDEYRNKLISKISYFIHKVYLDDYYYNNDKYRQTMNLIESTHPPKTPSNTNYSKKIISDNYIDPNVMPLEFFYDEIEANDEEENEYIPFADEYELPSKDIELKKPKYFNKVKVGFEWNTYNLTHYDKSNLPPKMVEGYKFNIYYPDLIDPTHVPEFRRERIPDTNEYEIIRFYSCAPYADIAFRIEKKEWDTNPRKDFRCVFEHDFLQLYFVFKRFKYKR